MANIITINICIEGDTKAPLELSIDKTITVNALKNLIREKGYVNSSSNFNLYKKGENKIMENEAPIISYFTVYYISIKYE
jgi:hypothetical protein